MTSRNLHIWTWLLAVAVVLMSLASFAPLSDLLDKILKGMAIVLLLAYVCASWREDRRKQKLDQSSSAAISSSDQT